MKISELAKELGVTHQKISYTRRKLGLPKGDMTEAEAGMIRAELSEDIGDIGPKFCFGTVTFVQEGSRRIEVTIKDKDGLCKRVPAFVPMNFETKKLALKRIKLEYIDYNEKRYYRHAALASKTWRVMSPELRDF